MKNKPTLFTSLSPGLLHLYDLNNAVVVIIDVFRATSTIGKKFKVYCNINRNSILVMPGNDQARCLNGHERFVYMDLRLIK